MSDELTQQNLRELSVQAGQAHFPSIMRFLRGIADGLARFPLTLGLVTASRSTAARTLSDRFGEWVNVRDFGAVGDGSTDDGAAIVAAIAIAAELGRPIYFPAGTYVSSPLSTSVSIHLAAGATLKAVNALADHLITITAHNVRIYGRGTIDGNKAAAIGENVSCIAAYQKHGLTFDDITIINAAQNALHLYDASGLRINRLTVLDSAATQVQIYAQTEDLENVIVTAVNATGSASAIKTSNISTLGAHSVRNVHYFDCTAVVDEATPVVFEIWNDNRQVGACCSMKRCTATEGAIKFSLDGVVGGLLEANTAIGATGTAFELASSKYSSIVGGVVDIRGSDYAVTGASVSGTSPSCTVQDLLMIDSLGTGTAERAIYIGDASHDCMVAGSKILARTQDGIIGNGVSRLRVMGRNIIDNAVGNAFAGYLTNGLRIISGLIVGNAGGTETGPTNGILLTGDGSTDDIQIIGNDIGRVSPNQYNVQGSFGPNILIRDNEGLQANRNPLNIPVTGAAPSRQVEIDQVENATSALHIGGSDGSAPVYLNTEGGGLELASNDVTGLTITDTGSVVCGSGALATNATDGFFYGPSCAGNPSGAPAAYTGRVPFVFDSTNNRLYARIAGTWRYVTLT